MHGMDLEGYAEQVLYAAMAGGPTSRPRASREEFRRFLDALAHPGVKGAAVNAETFSREIIYDKHDYLPAVRGGST